MHRFLFTIRWLFILVISFGLSELIAAPIIKKIGFSDMTGNVIFCLVFFIFLYPVSKYFVGFKDNDTGSEGCHRDDVALAGQQMPRSDSRDNSKMREQGRRHINMRWLLLTTRWLFILVISFGLSILLGLIIISQFDVSLATERFILLLLTMFLIYPVHKYLVDF